MQCWIKKEKHSNNITSLINKPNGNEIKMLENEMQSMEIYIWLKTYMIIKKYRKKCNKIKG